MALEKKQKDWFKIKRYPHIGLPLNPMSDRYKWIEKYVTNPEKVAKHSFLPFIHKTALVKNLEKSISTHGAIIEKVKMERKSQKRS
jgi:hypothetical protein